MNECALLTTTEMAEADRLTMASGVPSLVLMENAGQAVAAEATRMVPPGSRVAVLCGPGNNGGDGFVAARHLWQAGYKVEIALAGDRNRLAADAAKMADLWVGAVGAVADADRQACDLVIDAVFGAGLSRDLPVELNSVFETITRHGVPVLAVDVPSGVNGTTGALHGRPLRAARTVTFFRAKPGHLLMPGRSLCGKLIVADIGIPASVLDSIKPRTFANRPALWQAHYPRLSADGHKYGRGHVVVVSGPMHSTGAARLGARGALRVGAGLVSIASPQAAVAVNAAHVTAIMVRPFNDVRGLDDLLADSRLNAYLIGPGAGVGTDTRRYVEQILGSRAAVVLDADALTSFADEPTRDQLFGLIQGSAAPVVLTPHRGEFERLFGQLPDLPSKLEKARVAAKQSGAVIVLKGADSVIASPDGRAAINDNAPPSLATAGSGDVLAGFVTGLLAQGMRPFEAACAAVWLHGACASEFGPGLIAEDLPECLPRVLGKLAIVH